MNNIKYSITLLIACLLITACQKKEETTAEPAKVKIDLSSPYTSHPYHKGDTVMIAGTVSYITELHGYTIVITDTATKNVLFDMEEHTHSDKFEVNSIWVDTMSRAAVLKLTLTATIDHEGNKATKDLLFETKP